VKTLRRLLAHHRERSRLPDDSGFTLVELLVVIVVLPLLLGALAALLVSLLQNTVPANPHSVATQLSDSHDAQDTASFFNRDVQGANYVSAGSAPLCKGTSAGSQLLGLEWTSGTNTVDVSYIIQAGLTSPYALVRYYCSSATAPSAYPVTASSSVVISDNVFNKVTGTVTTGPSSCGSGIGAGATTCVADSSATYMAETVNCFNGSCPASLTAAPSSGSPGMLVHPTTSGGVGVENVVVKTQENVSSFQYYLTGTPRATNVSATFSNSPGGAFPTLIVNGSLSGGNCNISVNGAAAVNSPSDGSITDSPVGSITASGIYTYDSNPPTATSGATKGSLGTVSPTPVYATPVTSPYASLSTPSLGPPSNLPATAQYTIVTESASNWDPSTDPTVETNGVLNDILYPHGAIFEVTNGLTVSKGFSAPQGALFYVTGGNVAMTGNGNILINPLVPNFETPTQPLPELVLWDTSPGSLTIGGNGNTTVINGAIYAPNPSTTVTLNGGGNSGGLVSESLDIGGTLNCNGQDAVTVGSNGKEYSLANVQPSVTTDAAGSALAAHVSVYGIGTTSPSGTVSIYYCGPTAGAGCGQTTGWTPTAADQVAAAAPLTAGANSTSTASANFTPTAPGTYCFAVIYGGDSNYNGSSDVSSDGCFTVTAFPAPVIVTPPPPPLPQACYGGSGSCNTPWPGSFVGTATDPGGPGLATVFIALSTGSKYWNGTAWVTSATPIWLPASGTTSWTYTFDHTKFQNGNNTYTVVAESQDTGGTFSNQSNPVTFQVKPGA
jgi:prepilin-type N-terminal cleavage/methylation domain-containing protein